MACSVPLAMEKSLCVLLILAILAISMVETTYAMAKEVVSSSQYHLDSVSLKGSSYGSGSLKSYQCGGQCNRRCSQTQYNKSCIFLCNKCCAKCLCVSPGCYGNKQSCPCYNNWKTKSGGPKCP